MTAGSSLLFSHQIKIFMISLRQVFLTTSDWNVIFDADLDHRSNSKGSNIPLDVQFFCEIIPKLDLMNKF